MSGRADGWTSGRADERTRRSGMEEPRSGGLSGQVDEESGGRADGRTGKRVDKRVGLGLKGHIPRGPFHSWAPSPLASSERECVGCLGVQWGLVGFHVKHPYLAPGLGGLTCLI